METYDTTWVCEHCKSYVPIAGYSMAPDNPPLVIDSTCPGCSVQYRFSIDGVGQLTTEEI